MVFHDLRSTSTMYHELLFDATFWTFLFRIDQKLAEEVQAEKCPSCGCRLHCANYPRKPRGPRDLPDENRFRLSFCCARDGCRKRVTPPSVRFLGRKVYLGAVVILVSAMRQGPTPRRVRRCRSVRLTHPVPGKLTHYLERRNGWSWTLR